MLVVLISMVVLGSWFASLLIDFVELFYFDCLRLGGVSDVWFLRWVVLCVNYALRVCFCRVCLLCLLFDDLSLCLRFDC